MLEEKLEAKSGSPNTDSLLRKSCGHREEGGYTTSMLQRSMHPLHAAVPRASQTISGATLRNHLHFLPSASCYINIQHPKATTDIFDAWCWKEPILLFNYFLHRNCVYIKSTLNWLFGVNYLSNYIFAIFYSW